MPPPAPRRFAFLTEAVGAAASIARADLLWVGGSGPVAAGIALGWPATRIAAAPVASPTAKPLTAGTKP